MYTQMSGELTRMKIDELQRRAASYRLTRRTDLQEHDVNERRTSRFTPRHLGRKTAAA